MEVTPERPPQWFMAVFYTIQSLCVSYFRLVHVVDRSRHQRKLARLSTRLYTTESQARESISIEIYEAQIIQGDIPQSILDLGHCGMMIR
jgi:hypothetical protein